MTVSLSLALAGLFLGADEPAGPPKLVPGKFGNALDARATPVRVDGSVDFLQPPLTVECWAKLRSKAGFNVLVGGDFKNSEAHWEIYSYAGSGVFSAYLPGRTPPEIVSD